MRPEHYWTQGNKEQFLIQDPFGLREVVQPVVSISNDGKITGLGTCFQISPWLWMTAHHVVHHSPTSQFPEDQIGAVGFSTGLVLGKVEFELPDYFGEIRQCCAYSAQKAQSAGMVVGANPPDILFDVATLRVNVDNLKRVRLVSPLPIGKTAPSIGDEVFAIGYPILDSTVDASTARLIFEERMYGAGGIVTALHPKGTSTMRPWPTFQIEGDWRAGMSGGPVINMKGEMVGVVSSSLAPSDDGPGIGFAVTLSKIPLQLLAPEVDLENPGFVRGYGIFDAGKLLGFYPSEDIASLATQTSKTFEVKYITHNPKTDDWVML